MGGVRKTTLKDVARDAQVSAITVSRALREPEKVSPELRARIERAVAKLGYLPNAAASALASNRSSVIGVLIPSISNTVFTDVLGGISDVFEGSRFTLQIGNTRYDPLAEEQLIRQMLTLKPAGLIVPGTEQTSGARALLADADCPVVQVMDLSPSPVDMCIGFCNRSAARDAVEHMIAQGFARIGFLGARMDPRTQQRLSGYRDAMTAAKLPTAGLTATTPAKSSVEIGRHLMAQLFGKAPECDAIFCNNDDVAVGAALECQRRGIEVPAQMGICGFNDLGMTSEMQPAITSVHTPRVEVGAAAARYILGCIAGDTPPENRNVDLGYDLRVRASTLRRG